MASDGKINIGEYDYIMYVDASGDDGAKLDKGSSMCFATSCFMVHKDDIGYNLSVLDKIKHEIGCKEKDELKYTSLRKRKNSKKAHKMMGEFKGELFCFVAHKSCIDDQSYLDPKTKKLSSFCHIFPILVANGVNKNHKILIVIDRMKQIEEFLVKENIKDYINHHNNEHNQNYKIIFKDSKDENFRLLQGADIFAGNIRTLFEQNNDNPIIKNCLTCLQMNYKFYKTCNRVKIINGIKHFREICYIYHLFNKNKANRVILYGLTTLPVHLANRFVALDCLLRK